MSKRIFLITEYFDASQNTTGYLFEKLYQSFLKQDDLNVFLIGKKDNSLPEQPNALYIEHTEVNKKKLASRLYYEFAIGVKFFYKSAKFIKKGDLVFTGTTPIFLLLIMYVLKKFIDFKWILLVHDVFPENLVAAKIISKSNILYKLLKYLFDRIYASADQVIVIGKDMQKLVHQKTAKDNITIVPNWINEDDIFVEQKNNNSLLAELGWQNDNEIIFQFFGNIGRVQGLGVLLQAIEIMKEINNAKFIFIGNGSYVDELKISINKLNRKNVIYYGELDPSKKSIGLNACDISIVTLAEGMLGLGVPSKAYYTMAADKLIFAIMDKSSEVYQMVNDNNIGWTVEPHNIEAIAHKLDVAVTEFNTKRANSSRKVLIDKYSEKLAMEKILAIVRLV